MSEVSPTDDELVSSYLDGEATPQGREQVEHDPRLLARVEEIRTAIELLASPVSIPHPQLDLLRAKAVAASSTTPGVRDLRAAGAPRGRPHPTRQRLLAVAAALMLLGVAVATIRSVDSGEDADTVAISADDASDDADAGGETDADDSDAAESADDSSEAANAVQELDLEDSASAAPPATFAADEEDAATAFPEAEADAAEAAVPTEGVASDTEGDLFPSGLDPVDDRAALKAQITAAVESLLKDGSIPPPDTTDTTDTTRDHDAVCTSQLADVLLAEGIESVGVALATVGGEEFVVAVGLDSAAGYWMLLVSAVDCSVVEFVPLFPNG